MTHLHVYHFSDTDLGAVIEMCPSIPRNIADGENDYTPRICCCTSVTQCINALHTIPYDISEAEKGYLDLYLYEANIPVEDIYQPNMIELADVWTTGELWILKPTVFNKISHYKVQRQFSLPNYGLSRYEFTNDYVYSAVCNKVYDDPIYGSIGSFSMLMADPQYKEQAISFYEQNPYF